MYFIIKYGLYQEPNLDLLTSYFHYLPLCLYLLFLPIKILIITRLPRPTT